MRSFLTHALGLAMALTLVLLALALPILWYRPQWAWALLVAAIDHAGEGGGLGRTPTLVGDLHSLAKRSRGTRCQCIGVGGPALR